MLTPGQTIFEYKIIRPIGQGGFAAVFEAHDKMLDRRVAIKQLLGNRASDKKTVKRFLQEGRIAAALEHPNVVTIYGLRVYKHKLYMIMEYLPQGSLQDLLNKQKKLPLEQAVSLTIGICEGLAKLHEKGIIHRDLKAENILLTQDGQPKVIDFGIAHVPEEAGGLVLTQVGFQPSTLLYSSPEQIMGIPLDARSDVYQVGELLYYMLAGEHYINLSLLEESAMTQSGATKFKSQAKLYELLEIAICEKMPIGLKQLWREVGALAGVVEKALAKDKTLRFKDAAEFAATLKIMSLNTTPVSSDTSEKSIQDSRAYNRRGTVHISTRNYEQAIIDFSKAIALDTAYAEAYNNRSMAHLLMESYGQTVADCNQALKLAPDFVATYINRGIAYTGLREYAQALDSFGQVLKLDSKNVYAYYNRGNTHIWMTQYQEAITDYAQAININPEFVAAYLNRGVAYVELKNNDLAEIDFNQAIKLNPDYVHAYYDRANLHRELNRHAEAVADYSKVIEFNPEHRYATENRGDSYAALGDDERASNDYTRLITSTSTIHPKRLSIARSMLMPATPLDFLKQDSLEVDLTSQFKYTTL